MAGTVTGKNALVKMATHAGGVYMTNPTTTHSAWAIGDFSLTLSRDTVEQELIGQRGNFFIPGTLSLEGSLTSAKFGFGSTDHLSLNLFDTDTGTNQYLTISGCISTDTDVTKYIAWYLQSCQVTGYDVSMGDADTITEASIDFTVMLPQRIVYSNGCISDCL